MLGDMRLPGALLVATTAVIALPAIAAPRGRVVRVERTRAFPLITPILCFQVQTDGTGLCIGPQPHTGDVIVLVDETQVIAEVRVDGITKAMPSCDVVWNIQGSVLRGDVTAGKRSRTMGLIDGNIDRKEARRVPDDKIVKPTPDTKVELGIDRDGDGTADVVVAQSTCQGTGNDCIEFWTRRAHGLERVWSSNLRICQP